MQVQRRLQMPRLPCVLSQATVAVVVPFRGGCPYRERAWAWVRDQYAEHHPTWEVVEAAAPGGPWRKGAAVSATFEAANAEIVVQADADCWTEGLATAVRAVADGAAWAIPHRDVHRLTEAATTDVLGGAEWDTAPTEQAPYKGLPGGGIVVATRRVFESVPLDPRFAGWGQEDECWAMALETLLGPPVRGDAPLLHLWHPPQERMTRRRGSLENWSLRSRYFAARGDSTAMRALLEEFRADHFTLDAALHDYA